MPKKRWFFSITIIVMLGMVIFYMNPEFLIKRSIMRFFSFEFEGIVSDKYINMDNHSNKQILLYSEGYENGLYYLETPNNNEDIFYVIEIGDTLKKAKSSLSIVQNRSGFVDTINIRCCSHFLLFKRIRDPNCYSSRDLKYFSKNKFSYYMDWLQRPE